ncbi:MAG: zinc-dependent peptidase, partial [Bacteroidota bacterium]
QLDRKGYFRSYGKTNVHEFFAVAVENYIETPEEFKRQYPRLFKIITQMLNLGFYRIHPKN